MGISGISSGNTFSSALEPTGSGKDGGKTSGKQQLSEDEKKEVSKLQSRDAEVKAHESAHIAAGGSYIKGGAKYEYQTGPDGKSYAVGGEVAIDTSPVSNNPSATITKMQVVRSAALAPAQPSGQDLSVAAQATAAAAEAQLELNKQKSGGGGGPPAGGAKGQPGPVQGDPKADKNSGGKPVIGSQNAAAAYAKNSYISASSAAINTINEVQSLINLAA